MAAMGIRYYAWPVPARLVPLALDDPCPFHSEDPLADAWGPADERPPMLYLDKAWSELQQLFGEARPAAHLVHGEVTHTYDGWIPFERALTVKQVAAIAADLADYQPDDAEIAAAAWRFGEVSYVRQYLEDARTFTAKLAEAGHGLVYLIG